MKTGLRCKGGLERSMTQPTDARDAGPTSHTACENIHEVSKVCKEHLEVRGLTLVIHILMSLAGHAVTVLLAR
jgi:hypothetical protein